MTVAATTSAFGSAAEDVLALIDSLAPQTAGSRYAEPLATIRQAVIGRIPEGERDNVQALIVEELRRIHEGVLARYGVRPSEFIAWKARHGH